MKFTQDNRLEQLERKVHELERKLEEKPDKDEATRDIEDRLSGYQESVRSDRGDLKLKKNFVIENRKAIETTSIDGKLLPEVDNSATLYFNDAKKSRLNHMFLGYASAKGFYNTAFLSGAAVSKEGIGDIRFEGDVLENPHNGVIQFKVYHEKHLGGNGMPRPNSPDGSQPNIIIAKRGLFMGQKGIEGVVAQIQGTGENPYASMGAFVGASKTPATFVSCDKDNVYIAGIPAADPGVEGAIWRDGTTLKISLGT